MAPKLLLPDENLIMSRCFFFSILPFFPITCSNLNLDLEHILAPFFFLKWSGCVTFKFSCYIWFMNHTLISIYLSVTCVVAHLHDCKYCFVTFFFFLILDKICFPVFVSMKIWISLLSYLEKLIEGIQGPAPEVIVKETTPVQFKLLIALHVPRFLVQLYLLFLRISCNSSEIPSIQE